ncbi:Protein of unknown function [Cotesia congregata]|uniref:Uncharacterized protein n=1 Tax=Cotesia congregata TaxID=51543 RepID=A0A8J2H098_COTCN|nr:Protein of unknown function [Cotesia congregata]
MLIKVSCSQITTYSSLQTDSDVHFYSHVKRLLEFCFSDRLNPVVITEELYDKIHKIPWEIVEPPTIILDNNFESKEIQVFSPRYPTYVLLVSGSIKKLKTLFDNLKSTTTWSVESYFFIVDVENFCENANEVLKLLWKLDLLSSFYLCRESDSDNLIIYNYNPFTNYAPYPWRSAETTSQEITEKGTLLYQYFDNDRRVCHNITFDKTKTLGDHKIKTTVILKIHNATRDDVIDVKKNEISALLAGPSHYSIETLQNLFDHRYHVFYDRELYQDILSQNIWVTEDDKKFLHSCSHIELFRCAKNVSENSTIACIYKTSLQLKTMKKFSNVYMSKNLVFTKYYAPWTRKNWALKKKLDKISQEVLESGFLNHLDREMYINRIKKIRKIERIETSEQLDEVTEFDLIPAYKIFGVSLIIALLIFCVEVIIEKMFTHPKTDHKQTMSRVEPKIKRSKLRKTIKKHKRNRNRRFWLP